MSWFRSRDPNHERGVTLILFALALTAIMIMVAIIIDLGAGRQSRRLDRAAADAAVSAAAVELGPSQSPNAACVAAFTALAHNLDVTFDPTSPCTTGFGALGCVAGTPRTATASVGAYTITFTNPVIDSSPLMKAESGGGDVAQPVDIAHDGDACSRVGLQVVADNKTFFGGIAGTNRLTTDIHSVARVVTTQGPPTDIPALVALDPHGCNVVNANTGEIIAKPPIGSIGPGIIRTDTDNNTCSGNYVMNVQNTSAGLIRADGPSGSPGGGLLQNLATANVYRPGANNGPSSGYYGQRVTTLTPIGRSLFDPIYRCSSASLPIPRCSNPKVATFDVYNTTIAPLLGATGTAPAGSYSVLSGATAPFNCSNPPASFTPGNWYINCPQFDRAATFLGGGTVVFDGGVAVQQLVFNCALASSCATDKLVVIRGNGSGSNRDLSFQSSGAVLDAPRTTIFQAQGDLTMQGGPTLRWTAPTDPTFPTNRLMYWTESTSTVNLGGNPSITSAGVVFAPLSLLNIQGNGLIDATKVQFWVQDVRLQGSATFLLQPDPASGLPPPGYGSALIR